MLTIKYLNKNYKLGHMDEKMNINKELNKHYQYPNTPCSRYTLIIAEVRLLNPLN